MSREVELKKVYVSPKFVAYGSVAKLTQGGSNSVLSDSGNNMMMP